MSESRYPAAIRYLASQSTLCEESIVLVAYLWQREGKDILRDIDRARQGLPIAP